MVGVVFAQVLPILMVLVVLREAVADTIPIGIMGAVPAEVQAFIPAGVTLHPVILAKESVVAEDLT